MTLAEIESRARRQAEGGIDYWTIRADAEVGLRRSLRPDEAKAIDSAWAASAPARRKRRRRAEERGA